MSTLYRRGKTWYVGVPLRAGGWVKRSTGTGIRARALPMAAMIDELGPKGTRSWNFLDAVQDGRLSVPALHDAWSAGPAALEALNASLHDLDANDLIPGWIQAIRDHVTPDTLQHYTTHLRTLVPEAVRFPLSRLSRPEIARWLHGLECSPPTKRKYRAAASSFCNFLLEMGHLPSNPVLQVRAPKPSQPRMSHLEREDVIRLVEAQEEPFRTISALMHATGAEVGAVLRAVRSDLDANSWMMRIRGTKNSHRDRQVYVLEWARPYVQRHVAELEPHGMMFPGVTRWSPTVSHKRACAALGIENYWLRDSRHTFAIGMAKAGVPLQMIASQLGHRDIQMVSRVYARYQPSMAEMARIFDRAEKNRDGGEA